MSAYVDFTRVESTLFAGRKNGEHYRLRRSCHDVLELAFRDDQLVTSSFLLGLLEPVWLSNPHVMIRFIGTLNKDPYGELRRAKRRVVD